MSLIDKFINNGNNNNSAVNTQQPQQQSALDFALSKSPDYQPVNMQVENQSFQNLFEPSEQTYDFSPELVETKFNTDLEDWVNNFKNSWDETQKSPYQYKINLNQDRIDKNVDVKNTLDYLFQHKGIQEDEYNQRLQELEESNKQAQKNILDAQEGVDTNQKEIDENYVSKKYKLMEELVNSKGSDAGFLEAMQYTFPSGLGSMASMYGTQLASVLGSGTIKKLATAAVTGAVEGLAGGPAAEITVPVSMAVATIAQLAPIVYARNSETLAELGDATESSKSELINNWYIQNGNPNRDPNGPQPSEEDLRQIRMSSMKGVDELYKQNMLLAIPDAALTLLGSAFVPKGFSILTPLTKFANYNKYTRVGAAIGLGYTDSVSEKIEEGFQYAAQQRQRSKALDLDNYSDKGFMMNSLSDYYDTVSSINFGLPYQDLKMGGRYSDNPEFQSAAEAGGLLGIIGGGVKVGSKLFTDVSTYLNVSNDLKEKGVIDPDSKVFSLKNQIYAKYFDENKVDFLLEGVRNLATTKDENGIPLMTKENAEEEVKNITTAFDKYQKIEKYLNNIEPDGFLNLKRTAEQVAMLKAAKISLLNNTLQSTKYEKNLPQKGIIEIENNINNLIEQQNSIINDIEKETKENPGLSTVFSINQRLKLAKLNLENLIKTKVAFAESLDLSIEEFDNKYPTDITSLDLANNNKSYLIDSLNYEVLKDDYSKLKTIKDRNTLKKWFDEYMATVGDKQAAVDAINDENKRADESEADSEDILSKFSSGDTNELKKGVEKANELKFETKIDSVKQIYEEQNKNRPAVNESDDLYKLKNTTDNNISYWENNNKRNKLIYNSIEDSSSDKEEFKNYIKAVDSHIENLKKSSEQIAKKIKESNIDVINNLSDILDVFSIYLPEETKQLIGTINLGVLINNTYIKLEDYKGKEDLSVDNRNNKVSIKPSKINGKAVKLYLSNKQGNDIELGGILDPNRFVINGKDFNPNNLLQLQELNSSYVKDNKITEEGKTFVDKWNQAREIWKDIEKNNGLNNEQLQEKLYISNKNLTIYTVKQKGIDINDLPNLIDIVNKNNSINFSYKLGSQVKKFSGIPIVKYKKGKIIDTIWLLKYNEDTNTPFIEVVSDNKMIESVKQVLKNSDDKFTGGYKAYINNPQDNTKPKVLVVNFPKLDFQESISDALLSNIKSMLDKVNKAGNEGVDSEVIKDSKGRDIFFSTDIGDVSYNVTLNVRGINEKSKRSSKDKKPGTVFLNISSSQIKGDSKVYLGEDQYVKIYFDENNQLVHESNPIAGKKVIRPIQSNEDLVYVLNNILSFLSNKKDSSISNLDTVPFLRNIKVDLETPDEQSLLNIKSNAQIKIDPRIDITPKLKTTTQPPQQKSQSTSTTTQPPVTPITELDKLNAEVVRLVNIRNNDKTVRQAIIDSNNGKITLEELDAITKKWDDENGLTAAIKAYDAEKKKQSAPAVPISDKKADIERERQEVRPSVNENGKYLPNSIVRYFAEIFYNQRGGFNEFTNSEYDKLSQVTKDYLIRIYDKLKIKNDNYEIKVSPKFPNGVDSFYNKPIDDDRKKVDAARVLLSFDPKRESSDNKIETIEYPSKEVLRNLDEVFNGESAKYDAELDALEGTQTQPQPTTSNIDKINEIDNKLAKLKEDYKNTTDTKEKVKIFKEQQELTKQKNKLESESNQENVPFKVSTNTSNIKPDVEKLFDSKRSFADYSDFGKTLSEQEIINLKKEGNKVTAKQFLESIIPVNDFEKKLKSFLLSIDLNKLNGFDFIINDKYQGNIIGLNERELFEKPTVIFNSKSTTEPSKYKLHEFLHSLLDTVVNEEQEFRTELISLFDYVKTLPEFKNEYGVIGWWEFYTEGMTNPNFQAKLKNVTLSGYKGGKKSSVYEEFVKIINNILEKLGFVNKNYSALDEIINATTKVIEKRYGYGIKTGVQELFKSNPELANVVYEAAGLINTSEIKLDKPRFNPDNAEAVSYPIKINGKYAGVISVDNEGYISSSIGMAGIELEKQFQGQGYGTKIYIALAEQLAKEGKTLKSEAFGKADINEAANRVWKSLLDKNYAIDKGSYFEVQLKNKQQAQQLYSQYLDTIFPDSKVKDIVYRNEAKEKGSTFNNFRKGKENTKYDIGFYFTTKKGANDWFGWNQVQIEESKQQTKFDNKIFQYVLDIKNPKVQSFKEYFESNPKKGFKFFKEEVIEAIKNNNDALIAKDVKDISNEEQFIVFEPEQIHILGNKQDIERFKKFVGKSKNNIIYKTEELLEEELIDTDYEKIRENLSKILPDWIKIENLNLVTKNLALNKDTWGAFYQNVIYLAEKIGKGTEYHEAFHAVFRTTLSPLQRKMFYLEAAKKFGKPTLKNLEDLRTLNVRNYNLSEQSLTNLWYEEKAADRFQDFMNKKETESTLKGIFRIIFNTIKSWINFFKSREDYFNTLFSDIAQGKYKKGSYYEFNLSNPVYKLLKINNSKGYLSSVQSQRIINTIYQKSKDAIFDIRKEKLQEEGRFSFKNSEDDITILINDWIDYYANTYYNFNNFESEILQLSEINSDRAYSITEKIADISSAIENNRFVIYNEVFDKIKFLLKNVNEDIDSESQSIEDKTADSINEGSFDNTPMFNEYFPKGMKEYLDNITIGVDEFGFGNLIDLTDEKFNMASNTKQLNDSLTRGLVNTSKNKMFFKLAKLAKSNPIINSFWNKLKTDIGKELNQVFDENTDFNIAIKSNLANLFLSSYKKNLQSEVMSLYDPASKLAKIFRADVNDESKIQFEQWKQDFDRLDRSNISNKDSNIEIISEINSLMVDGDQSIDFDLIEEQSDNYISLDERVDNIKSLFEQIGINVSTGYIRYSILKLEENFINEQLENIIDNDKKLEYYTELKNELNLFLDSEPLSLDDLKGLESSFVTSNNPFVYSGIDDEEFESTDFENQKDTGSVGRLIKIAFNNAVFDESVGSTTYQNAENKMIYNKILPYYIADEIARLKSNAAFKRFIIKVNEEDFDFDELNDLIKESFLEDNMFIEPDLIKYFTNSLINNPYIRGINDLNIDNINFALFIFNELKTNIAGGIRSERLKETEESEIYSAGFGKSEGLSYGSLDSKAKLLDPILKFNENNNNSSFKTRKLNDGKTVKVTDYNPNVIEAKNTQILAKLPVYKFYKDDKITSLALDFLYNLFLAEYNRIGIANNDTDIIINKFNDFTSKDEQRGIDFFRFKRLAVLNPDLYTRLIESAKSKQNLDTVEDGQLKKDLIEGLELMANEQFNLYLNRLSEPSINIMKGDRENGYENNSLPIEYVVDDKINIDALGNFFFNDWLNSMSFNSIIHGDFALNYKDFVDVVKRNARFIAAGPSLGNSSTKILILKDKGANETSKLKNIIGKKTATDGQSQATLKWFIYKYALSLGKLKPNSSLKDILLKIEKGYIINDINEIKALEEAGLLTNPKKIVIAGRNEYDKTSAKIILRSAVSYLATKEDRKKADELYNKIFELREQNSSDSNAEIKQLYSELHNLWIPINSEKELHDRLNLMEMNDYDIASYETALKTIIPLQIKDKDILNLEVSDNFIKEQVITDAHKKEVVDGTQKLNLIWSEQDGNVDVHFLGKKVNLGKIKRNYISLLSLRMKEGYKNMISVLTNKDLSGKERVTSYKFLLEKLQESNAISNSDPYIMELYKLAEDLDKPAYNLNLPQILKKFENNYLAIISKNTIKWKVPGLKGTLVSDADSGLNLDSEGNIIPLTKFQSFVRKNKGEKIRTRKLLYREYDNKTKQYYTEIKISAQLAAQLNINIGDEIDENLIKAFGIRIPTQDKHSMGSFRVVDFLPMESGNEVMVPVEILALSGADFDIDSLFLRFLSTFNKKIETEEGIKFKRTSYGNYLKSSGQPIDSIINDAFQEFLESNLKYNLKLRTTLQELTDNFVLKDYTNIRAVGLENVKPETLLRLEAVKEAILEKALAISELPSTKEEFKKTYEKRIINNIDYFNKGDIQNIKPITLDEINNLLFESEYVLQYNEGNEEISNTPSSTDIFKDLTSLLEDKYDIKVGNELIGAESPYDKSIASENNDVGKSNIGPAAIYNIIFQRLINFKITSRTDYNNSFSTFISNGKRINDLISSILSAMTDNAKDPLASKFNLTLNAMGSALQGVGTNQGFNETMLLHKQEAIKNILDAFTAKNSPVNEDKLKYVSDSYIIQKQKENFPYDENDVIDYNFDNLAKAIKYKQDLENGIENNDLTQRQYNYLQSYSIGKFEILQQESKFILNLNTILQLLKGFPATWNEFEIIEESFKNLGIKPVLKEGKNPEDPNNYSFEHTSEFINDEKGDKFPYDLLPIFKKDEVVKTLSQIYFAQKSFSKRYFISQSPVAIEMKDYVKQSFKESTFKQEDNLDTLRTGLITFLSMKAYRHFSKSNINVERLFNKDLWESFDAAKKISPNNGFIKSLSKTKTLIKKGVFKDKILYKLIINTRTQTSPDFVISLMDEYKALLNNPLTKDFAVKAFEYLLIKDNLLFKNGSFIRNIEPALLGNISNQMNNIQDLFSSTKINDSNFKKIFGVNKKEIIKEFTTLYSLTSENSFNLLSSKSKDLFSDIKKLISELNPKEGEDNLTEDEIKNLSPFKIDDDPENENKRHIYIDIVSRTVKGATEYNSKQIKLNKKALAATGLFTNEKTGVGLPRFFYMTSQNKEGINVKRYFQLEEASGYDFDTKQVKYLDIWSSSKIIGSKAFYKEVDLFGTKEIASMYWTVDEHNSMKEQLDRLYKNLSTQPFQQQSNVILPGPETKINIYAGTGENAELSNFAVRPFTFQGISFNSVEQAYQSLKGGKFDKATYDNKAYIPFNRNGIMTVSKFRGPLGTTTDAQQTQLMGQLIKESFKQNPDALAKLLSTGNATLTHTQDKGKWGTEFPRLLMKIRNEFRSTQQQGNVNKLITETSKELDEPVLPDTESKDLKVDYFLNQNTVSELTDEYIDENFNPRENSKIAEYVSKYIIMYTGNKDKGTKGTNLVLAEKAKNISNKYVKLMTKLPDISSKEERLKLWKAFIKENIKDILSLSEISISEFVKYYNGTISLDELNNC